MKRRLGKRATDYPNNLMAAVDTEGRGWQAYQIGEALASPYLDHSGDTYRQIIFRHYKQGMTFTAIGEELGITGSRVAQLEHSALAKIRRWMKAKKVKTSDPDKVARENLCYTSIATVRGKQLYMTKQPGGSYKIHGIYDAQSRLFVIF